MKTIARSLFLLALVLAPDIARAEFVYGGTTLPTKSDLLPLPPGANANNYWVSADVASFRGASYDTRTAILAGTLHGFTAQGSRPVVSGASKYLWVDTGTNSLNYWNGSSNTVVGNAGSSFVPTSRTVSGTNGLAGGGDLSANRTIGLDPASFTVTTGPTKVVFLNATIAGGSIGLDSSRNVVLKAATALSATVSSTNGSYTVDTSDANGVVLTASGDSISNVAANGGWSYSVANGHSHFFEGNVEIDPNSGDNTALFINQGSPQTYGLFIASPVSSSSQSSIYLDNQAQAATNGDLKYPGSLELHGSQKSAGVVYDSFFRINETGALGGIAKIQHQFSIDGSTWFSAMEYGYTVGGVTKLLGFYGVTPVARPAAWTINGGAQAASNTIGAAAAGTDTASGHGFASTAEFNAFKTAVQSLQANVRQLQAEMATVGLSQ